MENKKTTNTPYDIAFKTMISDAIGTLIYLIIELFREALEARGICLTGKESIERLATENCNIDEDGEQSKSLADALLKIVGLYFYIECESTTHNMDALRMARYAFDIACKLIAGKTESVLNFPLQGVIFLRSNSKTPDVLTMSANLSGFPAKTYKFPVLKVSDYSAEDIVNKRLFFLIPFYIFNYEESFDEIKKGNKDILEKLLLEYKLFDASLKNALEEGILSDKDIRTISDVFKSVLVNITEKHETIREEILKRMSGTELDYPATTAFNEVEKKGRKEGRKEGNAEGQKKLQKLLLTIPKESEDFNIALKASTDELEELYKKYDIHSED
jgi:hypothetical protein